VRLLWRAVVHDFSKLGWGETSQFVTVVHKLKGVTYGSNEYKRMMEEDLPKALELHYRRNSHHPEHYTNGIAGMNMVDLVEMFCDWKAATKRHADGSMERSIDVNRKRFVMSEQLCTILRNS